MTHYETEIIDVHVALEAWLGRGEGDLNALLARFRPDFLMIPPSGAHIDYAGLVGFLENQRGSRPGLNIALDEITTLQTWDKGAIVQPGNANAAKPAGQRSLVNGRAESGG